MSNRHSLPRFVLLAAAGAMLILGLSAVSVASEKQDISTTELAAQVKALSTTGTGPADAGIADSA